MSVHSTDKVQGQDVRVAPDELLRLHKAFFVLLTFQATLSANTKLAIPQTIYPSFCADKHLTAHGIQRGKSGDMVSIWRSINILPCVTLCCSRPPSEPPLAHHTAFHHTRLKIFYLLRTGWLSENMTPFLSPPPFQQCELSIDFIRWSFSRC